MKIYSARTHNRTIEELKNCSNFKRVPKIRLEMISFLEEFQKTVTYEEAEILNNLRRMPYHLFLEQIKIYHDINRIYNDKYYFYKNLTDYIFEDLKNELAKN